MGQKSNNIVRWPITADHTAITQGKLSEQLMPDFLSLLKSENIPASSHFSELYSELYLPFCNWLAEQQNERPLVVGINGSQGSGKSTLTKILQQALEKGFDKTVVSISIDDLYKTRRQRSQLANDVHPLLATRGVPGTHDTELAHSIFSHLLNRETDEINLPLFDKSVDDRVPSSQCKTFRGECDIILFEGWCVGSAAQAEHELESPVNELEQDEDPDGSWRRFVNEQLKNDYRELFSLIDVLVLLKIPHFEKVFEWRNLQEQKLKQSLQENGTSLQQTKTMSADEIRRFIMHYERITRHTLAEMPDRCDVQFELGDDHLLKNVITRCNL